MIDHNAIVQAIADGLSSAQAAERFGVATDEIRAAQKQAVKELADGDALRVEWMLEDRRLKAIGLKFYNIAMRDNDPQAAVIFLKASERRASLNGANAPQSHSLHLMNQTAPIEHKTSTQQLRSILDNLLHISVRERELLDRLELQGEDTPEIRAEINNLRAERGKPPYGEPEPAAD
jgi:hypothetical protein